MHDAENQKSFLETVALPTFCSGFRTLVAAGTVRGVTRSTSYTGCVVTDPVQARTKTLVRERSNTVSYLGPPRVAQHDLNSKLAGSSSTD